MKKIMGSFLIALLLLTFGATSFAAEPKGWKFELMPYLWYVGVEGDVTVNGEEYDFDRSASDVFDAAEFAGSFLGVIQYNRFLFWHQFDYMSLSTDELDAKDQPARVDFDSDVMINETAVGYQIDGFYEGQTFDLMVGVRILNMENDLDVHGFGKRSKSYDLVDPMFVVRPCIPILPSMIKGLVFNPTLAIGGGGDSELVYELFPQIQYKFTDTIAMRLGYRTVGYKFEGDNNEDNELNVRFSGLTVGVGVLF